jgi:hypothetical protein
LETVEMRLGKVLVAGALGGALMAQAAAAHTPYLRPTTFAPERPYVTIEAGVAEIFFVPDFPIRSAGDYSVIGPDGAAAKVDTVMTLKAFAAFDAALPADGTYRITTGERAGRTSKWAKIDGAWKMVRPASASGASRGGEGGRNEAQRPQGGAEGAGQSRFVEESAVPPGAETMTSQSFSRVETYVTRGAPTRAALKPTGQGLELEPVTHPNEAFAGEPFKFRLLMDGKPLPGAAFQVVRAGDAYAESRFSFSGATDPAGAGAVTLAQPGIYVLEADYPARAEGAANPVARSAQYVLTFEVTR